MNSSYKGTAALVLGAFSIVFAACAASSDNTPDGSAGQQSSGGSGNGTSTTAGSPGTAGTVVSGTAGSPVVSGTAGAPTGSAGYNTGVGGAVTSLGGGTGTAGAATGTAGAAAMSCGTLTPVTGDPTCCVAAGTAADLSIDDLEDGDDTILPLGQRLGYWYTYGTDATQVPLPAMFGGGAFVPTAGGHAASKFAAATMGAVSPSMAAVAPAKEVDNQAGLGVGFNNHFNKSCPYDASAYKGITFWAKGTGPFNAKISLPTTVPAMAGVAGTCTGTCYDSYTMVVAPLPDNATWQQFTITFADATTFAQAGWGTKVAFDPSMIMDLQFEVKGELTATAAAPYNFAIDDVAFVAK